MEILTRGTPPNDVPYVVTCKKCDSTLKFTKKEARHIDGRGPYEQSYYELTCPVCNALISIAPSALVKYKNTPYSELNMNDTPQYIR